MMILLLYRLVEEVKDQCNVDITNDDVYMATTYDEFVTAIVLKGRGLGGKKEFVYDAVSVLQYTTSSMFDCALIFYILLCFNNSCGALFAL